jgi:hypothetical protein
MRMPLVVTSTHGGPYDREAFEAGYSLGVLNSILMDANVHDPFFIALYTASIPQLDLIAMEAGWSIVSIEELTADKKWSVIRLKKDHGSFALDEGANGGNNS